MQTGSLFLFVASLGIVWEHASSTSAGYCCPQITVALGSEKDGTYDFLAEGKGPAMKECQDACIYSKDSNKTDLYCFEEVTSAELGNGQVQCEAISPYSLMSTTPAVTGPTAEFMELLMKLENLQKDFEAQVKQTEALKKSLEAKVDAIDEKLNKTENKIAVCGYQKSFKVSSGSVHILTFDRVYDEVNSSSSGKLDSNGYFTAGVAGTYFITLETTVALPDREKLLGSLVLSSGDYSNDGLFIYSNNWLTGGSILEQASASRYVNLAAGETLHIELTAGGHGVSVAYTTMCVSLYSTSD